MAWVIKTKKENTMKKFRLISMLIAAVMVVSALFVFAACDNTPDLEGIAATIAEGEGMTTEQLLAKAKEETGVFTAYGNSSRISTAVKNFIKKYPELGLDDTTSVGTKKGDSDIYALVTNEYLATSNANAASMVMIQDGAQLVLYRESTTFLQNYVPSTMKNKVDVNAQLPLVHQYINKLFMWNKTGTGADLEITNVWQLVDPTVMNGRTLYFKSPANEQVNMNFLIMLTKDEWANKIKDAYKAYYNKDITLDSDCPNAGYQWVKQFLKQASFAINSDTDICNGLNETTNGGNLGLFVLSKTRDLKTTNNLQVAAWQQKNDQYVTVNPFAGFMYPLYCQVTSKAPRPYTAMLFINFLMEEDGFKAWGEDIGAYSSNPDLTVNEGDKELAFWRNTLVIEDAYYVSSKKASVSDFINTVIKSKAGQ